MTDETRIFMPDLDATKPCFIIGNQQLDGVFFSLIPRDEFFDSFNELVEDRELWEKGDFSIEGYQKDWTWKHLAMCYRFDDKQVAEQIAETIGAVCVRVIGDREEPFMDFNASINWYPRQWEDFVQGVV